jgi:hypothetical protein
VVVITITIIVATASCMVSRVDSVGDDDRYAGIGTMATQLATGELAP